MSVYAVIDSGKVSNMIVADADFVALIAPDHDKIVLQVGSCGIGDTYVGGLFVRSPQSISVESGTPATFTAEGNSSVGTVTYQWKKYTTNIHTATSAFLNFAETVPEDYGTYSCVVSDGTNTVETDPVTLTII